MTRVACLMMQKDEDLLLRPWLTYHGYLFGFENLYICDDGSSLDQVHATLREFAALGVQVEFLPPDNDRSVGAAFFVSRKLKAFRQDDLYDVVVALPPDEFLAVLTRDGVICQRAAIHRELAQIDEGGCPARTVYCFENRAGFVDLFHYFGHQRWAIPVRVEAGIDDRLTDVTLPPDQRSAVTDLFCLRMTARPLGRFLEARNRAFAGHPDEDYLAPTQAAYYADPDPDGRPVVRFRGHVHLLAALMDFAPFRAAWEIGRPADALDGCLEIDLDRIDFSAERYLEANPDLSPGNEFMHFIWAGGFAEGRAIAESQYGKDEVMARMAAMRASRPDGVAGFRNFASFAVWAGRAQEADEVLRDAVLRYPESSVVLQEYAFCAVNLGLREEGARRWDAFIARFPDDALGYEQGWYIKLANGDLDAAMRIVEAGLQRFPERHGLLVARAELTAARGDWMRARDLWNALLLAYPDDTVVKAKSRDTFYNIMVLGLEEEGATAPEIRGAPVAMSLSEREIALAVAYLGLRDANEIPEFFLKFESVGLTCEFGFVQRHFGAEPISLFRWSAIRTSDLMSGLEADFVGLNEPDNLLLRPLDQKYLFCDYRYNTAMHTFQYVGQADPIKLHEQLTRRMDFLRRNFLEDLAAGEKIFVHFNPHSKGEEDYDRLRAAFRRHGNSVVLFVRLADDASQVGRVDDAGGGLLLGYIEEELTGPHGGWVINYDGWMKVCRAAAAHLGMLVAS